MVLGLAPVQLMLCLKTQNAGKINSYRWIYNAFGRILNPEIVVNVDTGAPLEEKGPCPPLEIPL